MADIMCKVVSGSDTSGDACNAEVARRRQMEIRRLRIADPEPLPSRKRPRLQLDLNTISSSSDDDGVDGATDTKSSVSDSDASHVVTSEAEESCPGHGVTSVCGPRREMEDAVSIRPALRRNPGLHFFGVFDGHGCSHVANCCKERMHEVVAEEIAAARGGCPTSASDWERAISGSFRRMDVEASAPNSLVDCRCTQQSINYEHVGSTAVVAVVAPDHVVVGSCGDSRAVLCRAGTPVPLSNDHKPDRADELRRIRAAGGRVIYWDGARVMGVLAMSRAIGDGHLKPYVTAEPEVTVTERREEDECLIVASDGLWDVVSNETACAVARMCLRVGGFPAGGGKRPHAEEEEEEEGRDRRWRSDRACVDAAMLLTKLALARQTADNVSVVVVDLRRREHPLAED